MKASNLKQLCALLCTAISLRRTTLRKRIINWRLSPYASATQEFSSVSVLCEWTCMRVEISAHSGSDGEAAEVKRKCIDKSQYFQAMQIAQAVFFVPPDQELLIFRVRCTRAISRFSSQNSMRYSKNCITFSRCSLESPQDLIISWTHPPQPEKFSYAVAAMCIIII